MPTSATNFVNRSVCSRSTRRRAVLIALVLTAASFLRLTGLDRYPLPIHQDELSDIYDGYSLATTGADRTGEPWPILLRGIGPGDYHPGAYAYLAAIPAYFTGFSVRAGRLPAALAGILTVWLVYLTARRLTDDRTALLAMLFAAFSPIHILYSRQAHQGVCLVPLCVIAIVYALVRLSDRGVSRSAEPALPSARERNDTGRDAPPRGDGHADSLDQDGAATARERGTDSQRHPFVRRSKRVFQNAACGSQRQTEPRPPKQSRDREGAVLKPVCERTHKCSILRRTSFETAPKSEIAPIKAPRLAITAMAGFIIGLSTNAYAGQRVTALLFSVAAAVMIAWNVGVRQRAPRQGLIALTLLTAAVLLGAAPQLYAMAVTPDAFFARANTTVYPLHCGVQWWMQRLLHNLLLNLDPHYLFFSFGEYSLLSVARLNAAAFPFLYIGLLACCAIGIRTKNRALLWLPLGVLFSLAPALITEGNPSSMRSSGVWALYPIACAVGVATTGRWLSILFCRRPRAAQDRTASFLTHGTQQPESVSALNTETGMRSSSGASRRASAPGRFMTAIAAMFITAAGAVDVVRYLANPDLHGQAAQHHFVRIGTWLRDHGKEYERIYIDAPGMFGYLYIAAFSGMTPKEFAAAPREGATRGLGWDEYRHFGRFYFASLDEAREERRRSDSTRAWLVVNAQLEAIELPAPQAESTRWTRAVAP